jgi:hypothetical protein
LRIEIETLDQYLMAYGTILGQQAQENLNPIHDPTKEPNHPVIKTLLRKPYVPQAVVITATAKTLNRDSAMFLVGECGTGKTLMGMAAVHCHANGRPYRAVVFAPGQLVKKWKREIEQTIPDCYVQIISRCSDLLPLASYGKPTFPEWYVIGRDTAKLGPGWKPAVVRKRVKFKTTQASDEGPKQVESTGDFLYCPHCGAQVVKTTAKDAAGVAITMEALANKKHSCEKCDEPLWQYIRKPDRFEPAKFIHKQVRKLDYLIVDEVHENKGADTAQANAVGSLAAAARKVIAMTGTLIGGYAEHLRPLLFRLSPASLIAEGFTWKEPMPFNDKYGRIETVITERESGGTENSQSRGSSTNKVRYCRPGIMPTLFGAHLIGKAVFLGLQEMNAALPTLREYVVPIEMDPELSACYARVDLDLRETLKKMLIRHDRRLLGTMLNTLMAYPDHPFGWGRVGYKDRGTLITVVEPDNLDPNVIRPKERWFLDLVQQEATLGRQVWGYVQLNGERDVERRLAELLRKRDFNVKVLKASVPLAQREEWIDKNCQDVDVVLSHPRLVETGLDLFSKSYLGHNFCTLAFYETGYVLPTMRQASRRAWRLMQPKECKVYYAYYEKTMQQRAMELMGKKLLAAEALEGKFSSEGLVAMAGDDGIEMAMAKSLSENMDDSSDRSWQQPLDDGNRRPAKSRQKARKELVVIG